MFRKNRMGKCERFYEKFDIASEILRKLVSGGTSLRDPAVVNEVNWVIEWNGKIWGLMRDKRRLES